MIKLLKSYVMLSLVTVGASAQQTIDTLRYKATDAEKIFLENNLSLLTEKLNISQADAQILQARVWPNPTFTLNEVQLYKNETTDDIPPLFGNFWKDRNFAMQLEQLVYTAGKRKKNINLQVQNKQMAELVFADMLLALKAEFRQVVATLIYLQNVKESYVFQLNEVNKLLKAQKTQMKSGYISEAELFRLKGLHLSLQSQINEISEQMTESQQGLKNLMYVNTASYIIIIPETIETDLVKIKEQRINQLIQRVNDNSLVKIADSQLKISEASLLVEKANSIPNLNLMASYDRNGSVMRDFVGVGFSIDLPVFDRNKGNIMAARLEVEKATLGRQFKETEITNALIKSWEDLNRAVALYESIEPDYIEKLEKMTKAVGANFSNRNISLIEFLDYYESFRESREKYYEAIKNISIKKEAINYLIGSEL